MFFSSKPVNIQPGDKLKEGFLSKESRYRKVWRKRWCVLTSQHMNTFENEKLYSNPTEVTEISKIKTVITNDTNQGYYFVKNILFNLFIENSNI